MNELKRLNRTEVQKKNRRPKVSLKENDRCFLKFIINWYSSQETEA